MHPEILRELVWQHARELREQAHQATQARTAGRARRAARRHAADLAGPVIPAIPDYVDGSFRTDRDEVAGRVPTARRAAWGHGAIRDYGAAGASWEHLVGRATRELARPPVRAAW